MTSKAKSGTYFVVDETGDYAMVVESPTLDGRTDVKFGRGVRIDADLSKLEFLLDPKDKREMPDFGTAFGGLVVSERFREVLDEAGVDNVDYYPVRITQKATGEKHTGFFQANVIGAIACVDRGKSKFTPSEIKPKLITEFKDLRLDPKKVGGEKLFRLAEYPAMLIAHESVKKAIEKAKLSGIKFTAADGYET